jgi:MarR family transcriptional regulator, organic hydroperoxide resistance regulator
MVKCAEWRPMVATGKPVGGRGRVRNRRLEVGPGQTVTLPELLVSGNDHVFRELIALLYASIGQLQSMRRELAAALGVSTMDLAVLLALHHLTSMGRVGIRGIADHLRLAATNVTATVSELQSKGWLVKRADPDDRRALSIELTPDARQALKEFASRCSALNDVWFSGLRSEEMQTVVAFFHRLDKQYGAAHAVARSMSGGSVLARGAAA